MIKKTKFIIIIGIGIFFGFSIFGSFIVPSSDAILSSLKHQILGSSDPDDYVCWNLEQLLVERPNGEYACVYPYTAVKLNWNIASSDYLLNSMETKNGNFTVLTHFSRGSITNITLADNYPGININFSTGESGKLSITLPTEMMVDVENCLPQRTYPNYDTFFVLVNGVEVAYDERITTETLRYLEILYNVDSTNIEIIGECLI